STDSSRRRIPTMHKEDAIALRNLRVRRANPSNGLAPTITPDIALVSRMLAPPVRWWPQFFAARAPGEILPPREDRSAASVGPSLDSGRRGRRCGRCGGRRRASCEGEDHESDDHRHRAEPAHHRPRYTPRHSTASGPGISPAWSSAALPAQPNEAGISVWLRLRDEALHRRPDPAAE